MTSLKPLYKAQVTTRVGRKCGETFFTPAFENLSVVMADAVSYASKSYVKTVVVLKDQRGADHPDNKGKFFLYRIIK